MGSERWLFPPFVVCGAGEKREVLSKKPRLKKISIKISNYKKIPSIAGGDFGNTESSLSPASRTDSFVFSLFSFSSSSSSSSSSESPLFIWTHQGLSKKKVF